VTFDKAEAPLGGCIARGLTLPFLYSFIHSSLATIMITYSTDTLNFSSTENGIAILLLLIGSIPGAMIAGKTVARINPVRSAMLATLVLFTTTLACGILLKEPGQQLETYILAFFWGVGTGWKWTMDRLLASILIPPGQDAELMGVYLFAGQVLTWFPPLVFTVLNEVGVSQRIGIATLSIYFLLGFIALTFIGDYRRAVAMARGLQEPENSDPTIETANKEGVPNGRASDGDIDYRSAVSMTRGLQDPENSDPTVEISNKEGAPNGRASDGDIDNRSAVSMTRGLQDPKNSDPTVETSNKEGEPNGRASDGDDVEFPPR
jgi:MFS family permease